MSRTGASSRCDYRSGRKWPIVCRGGRGPPRGLVSNPGSHNARRTWEARCPAGARPIVCSSKRGDEGNRHMSQWKEPTMRKWWPLVAICAGACMLLVDVTIVNVALPDMARQLHTTFSDLQWVIDLYALVLGALVLTVGAVEDRLGRRAIYVAGLVLFAASSLTCGLAPNVAVLLAARGVQGLGAAAM